jgi:MoaA/NifB/PqqE/SkfB family radical SAM enzyme
MARMLSPVKATGTTFRTDTLESMVTATPPESPRPGAEPATGVAQVAARVARWAEGPQGPVTLEVYPTLTCNLACTFCDTTDRHRAPVNELSSARWVEIVDEAHALGVQRVFVLGGGEPLVRRDVTPALMRQVKALGMEGILTTNGTLLDAALTDELIDIGWDEIHFSIDGPTPEIHDPLRGMAGAFKKTVRAACRLAVRKRQRGLTKPRIALHFVLTRANWTTLPDMVRLAHSLGAFRIDFDALIAYTPEQQALRLTASEQAAVPEVAARALAVADELGVATTLENMLHPERMDRGSAAPTAPDVPGLRGAPCLKAWHYLVVQADGKTSPCCVLAGEGGSVRDQPVGALWQDDPFLNQVREGMLSKQPMPRCRECSWNILAHEALIRDHLP